jgi:phytoene dehydrogenase-like protein
MKTAIVIGGGHNGLIAAFYLAKAGVKPIVLEARDDVGGGAATSEIHPGFRCPTLTHEVLLQQRIVQDMDLGRHDLELLTPPAQVCSLSSAGALAIYDDAQRTQQSIKSFSEKDASAVPLFQAALQRTASVLASVFEYAPPSIVKPGAADLWNLLKTARTFRSLGKRDAHRLLRWGPMPVADLMHEWFEHELVRATMAGPALIGTMLGPRSAGSSLMLLMRAAHRQLAGGSPLRVKGGPGIAAQSLSSAARAAGAEIRTSTPVDRIVVRDGTVRGVTAGGQTIEADVVLSSADPKTTFLRLIEASELSPDFAGKIQNYRASGTVAKVNLALASLPAFGCPPEALTGRIQIGPDLDYLERAFDHAKYGEFSAQPWLELTIPSLLDSTLAPAGSHVASIYVHYAPRTLRSTDWTSARDPLLDATLAVLEDAVPGIRQQVLAAQVITPLDLEREHGFAGGHIFHGELALDQLFTMRPLLGNARYGTPIRGLYLCGGGTHPGGFMTGGSGRLAARTLLAVSEI